MTTFPIYQTSARTVPARYTARVSKDRIKLSHDMEDVVSRRTSPFLDDVGMGKSLEHLMMEAYLQGMSDAVECFEHREQKQ